MYKYWIVVIVTSCILGFLGGMFLKSPKIVKEIVIKTDTLRIKDTVRIRDTIQEGTWQTIDSLSQIVKKQGFEINFKLMNAYYVKRTYHEGAFFSVIGYKDKNGDLQDLYFTCSEEKHKQLVKQFKRQRGE